MGFVGDAIGDVVGGITGSKQAAKGAQKGADAQADAMREANQLQREIWEQTQKNQQPWLDAGQWGLDQLRAGLGRDGEFNRNFTMADFVADPGYQFRFDQGQNALESSAAARGMNLSGATLKALTQYGQDMGSQEFGNAYNRWSNDTTNRYNRLAGLAGVGQTANQQLQQGGQNFAAQSGQNLAGIGNARASGYIAQGNQVGNTLGQLGNLGSAAAAAYLAFSDRRLKSNIRRIGTHASGLPWYEYEIFGRTEQGVMADEAMALQPDAVSVHPSGFLMVNYGTL